VGDAVDAWACLGGEWRRGPNNPSSGEFVEREVPSTPSTSESEEEDGAETWKTAAHFGNRVFRGAQGQKQCEGEPGWVLNQSGKEKKVGSSSAGGPEARRAGQKDGRILVEADLFTVHKGQNLITQKKEIETLNPQKREMGEKRDESERCFNWRADCGRRNKRG